MSLSDLAACCSGANELYCGAVADEAERVSQVRGARTSELKRNVNPSLRNPSGGVCEFFEDRRGKENHRGVLPPLSQCASVMLCDSRKRQRLDRLTSASVEHDVPTLTSILVQ